MAAVASDAQVPRRSLTDACPQAAVATLMRHIGVEVSGDLEETPARVVKALVEMTSGYAESPSEILSKRFDVAHAGVVVLKGIRFTSLCEHHMLPFTGHASVAYIPGESLVGISKLARLVECFAKRLQVQERLGDQVADALVKYLNPVGAAVQIRAHHECMGCRGVKQPDAEMVTSSLRGVFFDDPKSRAEILALL